MANLSSKSIEAEIKFNRTSKLEKMKEQFKFEAHNFNMIKIYIGFFASIAVILVSDQFYNLGESYTYILIGISLTMLIAQITVSIESRKINKRIDLLFEIINSEHECK